MRLQGASADRGPLGRWNHLDEGRAAEELRACCAADTWVRGMLEERPFRSRTAMLETADRLVRSLDEEGLAQALAAHGRIGERRSGGTREATWSREEQGAALAAGADVRTLLEEGNRAYERRFGRVFLIRAAGRAPEEMYEALQDRLSHDDETERGVVLHELGEIVRLRLERLVSQ